jgi:16S rRNA (adenine1518-N6/adenine1519-N6)-dimethyltransferase
MARQRLGQHFLSDLECREQIARAIGVSRHSIGGARAVDENSCWVEIGAGHGEMTENLAASGAPVYAIELDAALVAGLRRLAKQYPNLTVVPGDILELDLAAIAPGRRLRIYGNLPYYITSPILQRLFAAADLLDEIHVVIQHEVALRLAAAPSTSDYGYLSVLTQYFSRPEIALAIPRDAFTPPPEVESALVTLRFPGARAKLAISDEKAFFDFVKLCFAKKRKTLVNNLRSLASPADVREALEALGLRPDGRAEQLTVAQFAVLANHLRGGKSSRQDPVDTRRD